MSDSRTHKITLIPGDGIGPEVTQAVVRILESTGVKFEWERFAREFSLNCCRTWGKKQGEAVSFQLFASGLRESSRKMPLKHSIVVLRKATAK